MMELEAVLGTVGTAMPMDLQKRIRRRLIRFGKEREMDGPGPLQARHSDGPGLQGAFTTKPLDVIEYVMHELAHWMGLGHDPNDFYPHIGFQLEIENELARLHPLVSDLMEVEANAVVHIAAVNMGLWTHKDLAPIFVGCVRNLHVKNESTEKWAKDNFIKLCGHHASWKKAASLEKFVKGPRWPTAPVLADHLVVTFGVTLGTMA